VTLRDSEIFNETKHRAISMRQLSFLANLGNQRASSQMSNHVLYIQANDQSNGKRRYSTTHSGKTAGQISIKSPGQSPQKIEECCHEPEKHF